MNYSIYPTDSKENLDAIIDQALKNNVDTFFTSLHIPEANNIDSFLMFLKQLHENHNFKFIADISSYGLKNLGMEINDLSSLKNYGIFCLRLDFGIELSEVKNIKSQGFEIAINASTVTKNDLEKLDGIDVIGFHNYYPRPFSALSFEYYQRQNKLLKQFNLRIWSFIQGQEKLRLPLKKGLPTLESQRNNTPYINYVELKQSGSDQVFLAEGIIDESESNKIKLYEEGLITLVCVMKDETRFLTNTELQVRIEESDYSYRIEDTRYIGKMNLECFKSETNIFELGAIYTDSSKYLRYQGEIHIGITNLKLDSGLHKIGQIKDDYLRLIKFTAGKKIIFIEESKNGL